MMKEIEQSLLKIEKSLNMLEDNIRSWNQNYFQYQKNRYKYEIKLIKEIHQSGPILEIGSLPYHMTALLKGFDLEVTGLDLNPNRGTKFIQEYDLNIVACDIERDKFPFKDESFRTILFMEVFEHLRIDPIYTLKEINRILSNDGKLILSTPNKYKFSNILHYLAGRSYIKPYQQFEKLHTLGHMGHVREYDAGELKEFLDNTGFKIERKIYKSYKFKWSKFPIYIPQHLISVFRPYVILICTKSP